MMPRASGCGRGAVALRAASAALWRDEAHVQESRELYRQKFDLALDMLDGTKPFDLRERRQEKYLRMGMV